MIRYAEKSDLKEILAIYNEAILNTTAAYDYRPHTLEERTAWYEEKLRAGFPVLVFEAEGHVAGFATYGPFRSRPAYKYTVELSIYVHKDYRRQQVGTSLLDELIRVAKASQVKAMIAAIDAGNQASRSLCEKAGFVLRGLLPGVGYKFGRWLDLALYELELEGPSNPVEA